MRAMEAAQAALMRDAETARRLEAIVQVSFTKTERWRIPIVFVKVCKNKKLKGDDAQIWQKVTATIQSEADADRLATMLEPFGLTVPPEVKRELSYAGAFNAAALQSAGVVTQQPGPPRQILQEATEKVAPLTVTTARPGQPLEPLHAAPAQRTPAAKLHVEPSPRVAHKPQGKTPTSKHAAKSPAHKPSAKHVKVRPTGASPASVSASAGEDSALHPAIKRLVDTVGSAASALRSNFRGTGTGNSSASVAASAPPSAPASAPSSEKADPASINTSINTSITSMSTSTSTSFSTVAASFSSRTECVVGPCSDDNMQYVVFADNDGGVSQLGLYCNRDFDFGRGEGYGSGASVSSADTQNISCSEQASCAPHPHQPQPAGFEDEAEDEALFAQLVSKHNQMHGGAGNTKSHHAGRNTGSSTSKNSARNSTTTTNNNNCGPQSSSSGNTRSRGGVLMASFSTNLTALLFRSNAVAPAPFDEFYQHAPCEPCEPSQPHGAGANGADSGLGNGGNGGNFSLVRMVLDSFNSGSSKQPAFPAL